MIREYKIPKKSYKLAVEYEATELVIEKLLRSPFHTDKAIKLQMKNVELRIEMWRTIYKNYPKLKGKQLQLNYPDKIIIEVDAELEVVKR